MKLQEKGKGMSRGIAKYPSQEEAYEAVLKVR